ncbi:type II secretion system F family protein [Nocardioides sp. YIM 152315]|uniref:type II secretion system F family protein n=1 Tax=Nocardioides sp. YIM 152315 TaxID=3031760 RepID=UPI0023DC0DFF|nr:type II secretion system F family protein [Nocardioides sp. YIM 152315]MDF1603627.1 type II secretion system F family protein [Nocardioides sp. YIM 152315]
MSAALAAGCAAAAVALLVRPPPRLGGRPRPAPRALLLGGAAVVLLAVLLVPDLAALIVVGGAAAVGGVALVRRQRARRAAEATAARVLETCEAIASELAGGLPPGDCLDRAARAWEPLAPVAAAFRVGADVPGAMRAVAAGVEGAADLRVVAAAWQVAHRTGEGLASTVDRVAESLRADSGTRRVVSGELASARATARLVAGLPIVALLMGSGTGGDPWGFLLGTPAGMACLAAGLAFGLGGLWWIEAIARDADRAGPAS